MQRAIFKIRGLDCAEEVDVLQRAVGPVVGGEAQLTFDILNGTMTVPLSEAFGGEAAIRQAVAQTGMEAILWQGGTTTRQESRWHRHGRTLLCVASGLGLVGGLLGDAWHQGSVLVALAGREGHGLRALPPGSMALYLGSVLSGAWFVAPKALYALRSLRPDMNLLMLIAVAGAMALGDWFEAAAVAFLFSLALLLESWSVQRARRALQALVAFSPTTARCVIPGQDDVIERPVEEVAVDTTILVRPGEKIPLDGIVTSGATSINQAPITGESIAVSKGLGDDVFAGTINGDGVFTFRTTKPATDTTLARIVHLIEAAHTRRAPSEQWIQRFARVYTPVMLALAVLLAIIPPMLTGEAWSLWFYRALVLLVIACPCALVIATPVSIVASITAAARAGVLIKGGTYIEAMARLRVIAFDKTGTLTSGHPTVQALIPLNGHTEAELLASAAALESHSLHPLARAILARARALDLTYTPVLHVTALPGKGATALVDGARFWIGSHRLMEELGLETTDFHKLATDLEDAGHSLVAIGNEAHICGLISIADEVRHSAPQVVQALKNLPLAQVVMLSGDNQKTVQAVAAVTGVDRWWCGLLPEDKVRLVEELSQRFGPVAIVGDGVNDAPAMAAASIGIAMGAIGTDVAIETADIALMSDDLAKLPWLIRHARRTLAVIQQNIVFTLSIKLAFIALAGMGIATLWLAIAADMGASLLVISNSLRLLRHSTRTSL